jgi:hypothetical protein
MAAGVTVAHTDLPVFSDMQRGRVFPLGDVNALKDIMLDEFRLWRKTKSFLNAFSWKRTTEKLLTVLEEIHAKS